MKPTEEQIAAMKATVEFLYVRTNDKTRCADYDEIQAIGTLESCIGAKYDGNHWCPPACEGFNQAT